MFVIRGEIEEQEERFGVINVEQYKFLIRWIGEMKKAIRYFMDWYRCWSPAGYYECKCCGFSWPQRDKEKESHSDDCPVLKFRLVQFVDTITGG